METDWWYCIKDTPYDIDALNAKKRYEIVKARRNFRIEKVDPTAYIDEMFAVLEAAHAAYPAKYRPQTTYESFSKEYIHQGGVEWVVAFCNNEQDALFGKICGYTIIKRQENVLSLVEQKSIPEMQKYGLNAALIDFILLENNPLILRGGEGTLLTASEVFSIKPIFKTIWKNISAFAKRIAACIFTHVPVTAFA